MKIIRPYGSSSTDLNERSLSDKNEQKQEITLYCTEHEELVIAQWISIIDKIIIKPKQDKAPSDEQRSARTKIGEAAWKLIIADMRLKTRDTARLAHLARLWNFKIHPYGTKTGNQNSNHGRPLPSIKGRWYKVFVGDNVPVEDINPQDTAQRISEHLYEAEYRIKLGHPKRRKGLIQARAESIKKNVPSKKQPATQPTWSDGDIERYTKHGDVAAAIWNKATECETNKKPVRLDIAAACLYDHWAKIFFDPATKAVLNITQAKDKEPNLYALHMAIKRTYTRILKNHRKNTKDQQNKNANNNRKISSILPRDMQELLRMSRDQKDNTDIASLVRLGKIIHYTASDNDHDNTKNIIANWPQDVSQSRFWTSDGQAEIKRAESFVRVWRRTLSYATLTLRNWASIEAEDAEQDLLGSGDAIAGAIEKIKHNYDHDTFKKKTELLFGKRAASLLSDKDKNTELLNFALKGARDLRNASFHFKGLGMFIKQLEALEQDSRAKDLWEQDNADYAESIRAKLKGAHAEFFFTQTQNEQLLTLLAKPNENALPLPRFSRVLLRAENTRDTNNPCQLPAPTNRTELEENPARLCQYTALKSVYEKDFRVWLTEKKGDALHNWIDSAIKRTTKAARTINGKKDENNRDLIISKAAGLPKPKAEDGIAQFLFKLSAATASEMRVQRGYESDGEKAKEQAEYIDEFLCDVIALALADYLKEKGLQWLAALKPDQPKAYQMSYLEKIPLPKLTDRSEEWQATLYLLLHMIPVEDAGKLLHQIKKWEITASRPTASKSKTLESLTPLLRVLHLYLDMHDAKFEGGMSLASCEKFSAFFETQGGFDTIFPKDPSPDAQDRIPKRGLREVMRFGHFPLLQKISTKKITNEMIEEMLEQEKIAPSEKLSKIAKAQHQREDIHKKWAKAPKNLSNNDKRAYCEALRIVINHRKNAAQVNLVNHVRIHRLLMSVLARLLDYSGLFERDLYFVTLAHIHLARKKTDDFSTNKENRDKIRDKLKNGQIIESLNIVNQNEDAKTLCENIAHHFGSVWEENNNIQIIRNNLSHFNMLELNQPIPDLTHWVNQTRKLVAYDRKLKNAVSQSVNELLQREGIIIDWVMNKDHQLENPSVTTAYATHLKTKSIQEALHGEDYIHMVVALLKGHISPKITDITTTSIDEILRENAPKNKNYGNKNHRNHAKRP